MKNKKLNPVSLSRDEHLLHGLFKTTAEPPPIAEKKDTPPIADLQSKRRLRSNYRHPADCGLLLSLGEQPAKRRFVLQSNRHTRKNYRPTATCGLLNYVLDPIQYLKTILKGILHLLFVRIILV